MILICLVCAAVAAYFWMEDVFVNAPEEEEDDDDDKNNDDLPTL
jgi:hypothetical protein